MKRTPTFMRTLTLSGLSAIGSGSTDSAAMVNIFTPDARVLPRNADPVVGRRAIEVLTAQYLTFGITAFREETTAFYGNQNLLIDEGTYVMVYDRGRTTEMGKYANIWRRDGRSRQKTASTASS